MFPVFPWSGILSADDSEPSADGKSTLIGIPDKEMLRTVAMLKLR